MSKSEKKSKFDDANKKLEWSVYKNRSILKLVVLNFNFPSRTSAFNRVFECHM